MSSVVILAASVFEISCEKNKQTHRQTEVKKYPPLVPSAWVITLASIRLP